jgi:adenine phosphoribosyltransferase
MPELAVDGDVAQLLRAHVRDVQDFPTEGVLFKDITPLLADAAAFRAAVDAVVDCHGDDRIDKVVGIEARGFLLAAPAAYHLSAGFVPVRKKGKLPGATHEVSYDLEYGSATLQVVTDAFSPGDRVLVVDDVLATGGTAAAAIALVLAAGGVVVGVNVLLELPALGGRAALAAAAPEIPITALLEY